MLGGGGGEFTETIHSRMEEPSKEEEGVERARCTENNLEDEKVVSLEGMNRKEKRKAIKKLKRKQMRKEMAALEREEEAAQLNDPEEQRRLMLLKQEEAERVERERKLFEERERAWIEAMEKKMKHAAEEEQRKLLEETHKQQVCDGFYLVPYVRLFDYFSICFYVNLIICVFY